MQAGQDVDEAVEDDQIVDSRSLLPQDDLARPGVDHDGDHREDDVGVEVATCLGHVNLKRKKQFRNGEEKKIPCLCPMAPTKL